MKSPTVLDALIWGLFGLIVVAPLAMFALGIVFLFGGDVRGTFLFMPLLGTYAVIHYLNSRYACWAMGHEWVDAVMPAGVTDYRMCKKCQFEPRGAA